MTGTDPPKPRVASVRKIVDPKTKDELDRGLVLFFEGVYSHDQIFQIKIELHISIFSMFPR